MTRDTNSIGTIEIERQVLQAMCQGTPQGSVLEVAKLTLINYRWREPVHRVIYEVLMALPSLVPEVIREQLPARLTRKGFPDVTWEDFLSPHSLSKEDAEGLIRQLCGSM